MKISLLALGILSMSCALTSKAEPVDIRWFSPEPLEARDGATSQAVSTTARLCLGRVTSSAFLRNRIVYRDSAEELGTYDDRRWTEYPEVYLRRSLRHGLFDTGKFVEPGAPCPTLDVELVEFEEVRRGTTRFGRVRVDYRLHADQVTLTGTIIVEAPASPGIPAIVAAIGKALEGAVSRVGDAVTTRLAPSLARGVTP